MNILKKTLILAGLVAGLGLGTATVMAQPPGGGGGGGGGGGFAGGGGGRRGNFDPQMMLDRFRQDLSVTNDAEWTAISAKITSVMDARRAAGGGGRGRRGGGGGGGGQGGGPGGPPQSEAMAALQKAFDDKAPAPEVKDKIAKVREENKTKQAALVKAQEDLRSILDSHQEAYFVLQGFLQ